MTPPKEAVIDPYSKASKSNTVKYRSLNIINHSGGSHKMFVKKVNLLIERAYLKGGQVIQDECPFDSSNHIVEIGTAIPS
jgi:hypothetical protein